MASVTLKYMHDNRIIEEAATGTGPITAVFKAIDRATGVLARLRGYRSHTTADASQQAEVILELEDELDDRVMSYQGRALSQDSIFASAQAYINAIDLICKDRARPRPAPANAQRHGMKPARMMSKTVNWMISSSGSTAPSDAIMRNGLA